MKYNQPYGVGDEDAAYVNGDPSIGRQGSIPPAAAFEYPQREIVELIEKSDQSPSNDDLQQLLKAARSQRVNYAEATNSGTGDENAITVEFDPPVGGEGLLPGTPIRVKMAQDISGACGLIVDGITYDLKRANLSALDDGELKGASTYEFVYNGDDVWVVSNFLGFGEGGGGDVTNNNYTIKIPFGDDTSEDANAIVANTNPSFVAYAKGDLYLIKLANSITGPTTAALNGLPAKAVKKPNGAALASGAAVAGQMMLLSYDGTNLQFLGIFAGSVSDVDPGGIGWVTEYSMPFISSTGLLPITSQSGESAAYGFVLGFALGGSYSNRFMVGDIVTIKNNITTPSGTDKRLPTPTSGSNQAGIAYSDCALVQWLAHNTTWRIIGISLERETSSSLQQSGDSQVIVQTTTYRPSLTLKRVS